MSLDIGSALSKGAERTIKKNGLFIAGLLFIVSIISTITSNSLVQALLNDGYLPSEGAVTTLPLSLGLSTTASATLVILSSIIALAVGIAAIRTFVSSKTESIPKEFFTRNLGWALLNLVVGGIAFTLIIGLGLLAFIIPGIFLLVSLYFWNVFVVIEDQNFIEAFKSSWGLTKGSRVELFGLGAIVVVAAIAVGSASALLAGIIEMAAGETLALLVETIPEAIFSAFSVATLAQAYNQLKE